MLSTLLSSLTSYFSKYFLVSAFMPMLAFGFLNALGVYLLVEPFHGWIARELFRDGSVARSAFVTSAVAVALLIGAYVLSSLGNFLRGLLEGRWPWEFLRQFFVPLEERRLRLLTERLDRVGATRHDLEHEAPHWQERLLKARRDGTASHPGHNAFSGTEPIVDRMRALRAAHTQNRLVEVDALREAVNDLARLLEDHDARVTAGPAGQLGGFHSELLRLVDSTKERAVSEHLRLHNERYSNFGSTDLAPTRMGNIANTVQSYAVRRYDCNLELVWSQLQRSVQKDDKAYATLLDSKSQLDFLVACAWLTAVSTALWVVILAISILNPWWFTAVALIGPVVAYVWYRAACENYRSFADVMMTSLDLFRFDVLHDMRLTLPADVEQERWMWDSLNRLSRYGDPMNFRYQHPKT